MGQSDKFALKVANPDPGSGSFVYPSQINRPSEAKIGGFALACGDARPCLEHGRQGDQCSGQGLGVQIIEPDRSVQRARS